MTTDTPERLVVAAWECVRKHGTAGATSRAVTAAADANLGAITYYFGSKDALVAEAVGGAIEALLAPALHALQDEALDPVGRLLGAVTQLQQAYEQSDEDAAVSSFRNAAAGSSPTMTGGGCRGGAASPPTLVVSKRGNLSPPRSTGGGCRGGAASLPPTLK